jgi:hypothetical protein
MAEPAEPSRAWLDWQEAHDLVDALAAYGLSAQQVWAECLNGRWVVFVRHAERTYVLLPLLYSCYRGISP